MEIVHNSKGTQMGITVKAIKERGGFEVGVTYQVYIEKLKGGSMQVYSRLGNACHIYCHGGIKEVNQHFELA